MAAAALQEQLDDADVALRGLTEESQALHQLADPGPNSLEVPNSSPEGRQRTGEVGKLQRKVSELSSDIRDTRRKARDTGLRLHSELEQAHASAAAAIDRADELDKLLRRQPQGDDERFAEMHAELARAETEVARMRREVSAVRREAQQQAKAAEQRSEEAAREVLAVSRAALALQETEATQQAMEGGLAAELHRQASATCLSHFLMLHESTIASCGMR